MLRLIQQLDKPSQVLPSNSLWWVMFNKTCTQDFRMNISVFVKNGPIKIALTWSSIYHWQFTFGICLLKKFLIQGKQILIILIFKKWINIVKSERTNNKHQISLKDRNHKGCQGISLCDWKLKIDPLHHFRKHCGIGIPRAFLAIWPGDTFFLVMESEVAICILARIFFVANNKNQLWLY